MNDNSIQNKAVTGVKNEIYDINPFILNTPMGYSAQIDGDSIMVKSHCYGEGFNSNNEKIRIISEEGYVMVNGERTPSGKFESLSSSQLFQLVSAGVIILDERQRNDFRKQFFADSGRGVIRNDKKGK